MSAKFRKFTSESIIHFGIATAFIDKMPVIWHYGTLSGRLGTTDDAEIGYVFRQDVLQAWCGGKEYSLLPLLTGTPPSFIRFEDAGATDKKSKCAWVNACELAAHSLRIWYQGRRGPHSLVGKSGHLRADFFAERFEMAVYSSALSIELAFDPEHGGKEANIDPLIEFCVKVGMKPA